MYNKMLVEIVSFCVSFFLACNCFAGAVEIQYEDALGVVKSCEKGICAFKWKIRMQITTLPPVGERNSNNTQNFAKTSASANVFLDCLTKRFKVDQKKQSYAVMRDNSVMPYLHESSLAYDGTTYSAWRRDTPQKQGTAFHDGSKGEIAGNLDDFHIIRQFLDEGGLAKVGFRTGIPCFFRHSLITSDTRFFSEFLSEWKKEEKLIALFRQDDGDIVIYARAYPEPLSHYVAKVVYSPKKNGIITEYSTLLSYSKEKGEGMLDSRLLTQCKQNQDGTWVPSTAVSFSVPLAGQNGYNSEVYYEEFEYLPKIPVKEFQVTFPDGTTVEDHVAKKFYKVGDLLDEDKAIDEFILRHGLTGNVPPQVRRGNVIRYILMGTGIIMIVIALYQMIQQKRRKE